LYLKTKKLKTLTSAMLTLLYVFINCNT